LAEAPRLYAGLDVTWTGATGSDDDPMAGLVLAETDEFHPSAVEFSPQGLRVFFGSSTDREAASAHLGRVLPDCIVISVDVPDERWAERSQAALKAVRVGTLTVAPPWDVPADRSKAIIIQPSMGFGTGHHASTRLCLHLLQASTVAGATVMDVGTGSGVLAIAASKLGAASVVAIDFDSDAIASAQECLDLNALTDVIELRQVDLERESTIPGEFDIILANLTGGMLIRMAARLCALTVAGGTLIVSGVTRDEEAGVTAAFQTAGAALFTRLVENQDSEWVGLRFTTPTLSV
jgi:ribosomal protein L11 methyltransferase